MLPPGWDKTDYLWETAETFSGKKLEVILYWHHLLAMQQPQLLQTMARVQRGSSLLEWQQVSLLGQVQGDSGG